MKVFFLSLIISIFSLSLANAEKPTSNTFSLEFNKMKALAGNWQGKIKDKSKVSTIKVNYKVSSGGSSVVETLFPGTPQEMVSIYTEVDGKLNMTHYCALQNQPTLRLMNSTANTLEFDYVNGQNLNVKQDAHMHSLKLSFKDKNTLLQQWTQFKNGKAAGAHNFTLSRAASSNQ